MENSLAHHGILAVDYILEGKCLSDNKKLRAYYGHSRPKD